MPSIKSYLSAKSDARRSRCSWFTLDDELPLRQEEIPPMPSPPPSVWFNPSADPVDPFEDDFKQSSSPPKRSISNRDWSSSPNDFRTRRYAKSCESLDSDTLALLDRKLEKEASRSSPNTTVQALKNKIYKHCDPRTIWSIVDVREIFWPFTWKKYAVLFVVAVLIATVVVTERMFHWVESSMSITRQNMLPVLVMVIGLEPCMMFLILLIAKIPNISAEDSSPSNPAPMEDLTTQMAALEKQLSGKDDSHSTALVIPCHNSDHVAMKRVLESAYPHFRPQDIFIIDNGRSQYPTDSIFRDFIEAENSDINYIWSPIGSKNAAQLVGAMAAKEYQFIMTVDDDVCIPANFKPPTDLVNDKVKGVAFPLKATDASGKVPLFMVSWQDCEYRMAGLTKLAESRVCGVLYPHGAGWFCERETLVDLISNYHSIDFIAEDVNTGLAMQKMKKFIAFDARCILETEVPTTMFGQGLNWYKQRVRSWEMGRHGRLFAFADRLFLSFNGLKTPWAIFAQKFIHCYSIACIVVDWVRVPILVTMGTNRAYWRQAGLLTLASMFPLLYYKYISCRRRPDLQPGFWGSVTYPFYKQLYSIVSIIGAIRSVVFYIGGHATPKTIREMVKEKDARAFWLDPRFESNPGFLADDGEQRRADIEAAAQRLRTSRKLEGLEKETDSLRSSYYFAPHMPASVFIDSDRERTLCGSMYSSPAGSTSTLNVSFVEPATVKSVL